MIQSHFRNSKYIRKPNITIMVGFIFIIYRIKHRVTHLFTDSSRNPVFKLCVASFSIKTAANVATRPFVQSLQNCIVCMLKQQEGNQSQWVTDTDRVRVDHDQYHVTLPRYGIIFLRINNFFL